MILKKPATVSVAVAAFKRSKAIYPLVIKAAIDTRQVAQARVMAAEKQLADVRKDVETDVAKASDEIAQAQKVLSAMADLTDRG